VSTWINLMGVVGLCACILVLRLAPPQRYELATAACILALAVPVIGLELLFRKNHLRPSTDLDFSHRGPWDPRRVGIKLLGLFGTLAVIGLCYWLAPEYHKGLYRPLWELLPTVLPPILILTIPYFIFVDRRMRHPEDGYFWTGQALLGRFDGIDRRILRQHVLGWTVKAFFLPLMFAMLTKGVIQLSTYVPGPGETFIGGYYVAFDAIMTLEVAFACTGYIFTVRLFDSHIRSTDPTLDGWVWAILCYPPFWVLFYSSFLEYEDGRTWTAWLAQPSALQVAWGVAILFFIGLYAAGSVAFGIRFSNLTHRGILTNGPYRFTKHPAYVGKNLSFWLISVPFLSHAGWDDALRHSLLLLCVNVVYFARAFTEERHLSRDPVYVEYALAMNERSLFRILGRLIPRLRYRPPAGSEHGHTASS
jgi:protein-S-isoprenylcysteine O-methyltransferase Ste14